MLSASTSKITSDRDIKSIPVTSVAPSPAQDQKVLTKIRIEVHSFDFDGCLFNNEYAKFMDSKKAILDKASPDEKAKIVKEGILAANQNLFNYIANGIRQEKLDKVYVMSGSMRQSHEFDKKHEHQNNRYAGLSLPAMEFIAEQISKKAKFNCTLDKTLMADIDGQKAGDSFKNSIALDFKGKHNTWDNPDNNKHSILYMQLHKIASENKDAEIHFHFYDDREMILKSLKNHFQWNSKLIPENVTLHLNHYVGRNVRNYYDIGAVHLFKEMREPGIIKGTGRIDEDYRNTLLSKPSIGKKDKFKKEDAQYTCNLSFEGAFVAHSTGNLVTNDHTLKKFCIDKLREDLINIRDPLKNKLQTQFFTLFSRERKIINAINKFLASGDFFKKEDVDSLQSFPELTECMKKYKPTLDSILSSSNNDRQVVSEAFSYNVM